MPYALSNLENGQPPSWRYVAKREHADQTETVIDDVEMERISMDAGGDLVWDASAGKPRKKNNEERLNEAKASAKVNLGARLQTKARDIFPGGDTEVVATQRNRPNDPKLKQLDDLHAQYAQAVTQVDSATSPEQAGTVAF